MCTTNNKESYEKAVKSDKEYREINKQVWKLNSGRNIGHLPISWNLTKLSKVDLLMVFDATRLCLSGMAEDNSCRPEAWTRYAFNESTEASLLEQVKWGSLKQCGSLKV